MLTTEEPRPWQVRGSPAPLSYFPWACLLFRKRLLCPQQLGTRCDGSDRRAKLAEVPAPPRARPQIASVELVP
jgi:hypothetical protein